MTKRKGSRISSTTVLFIPFLPLLLAAGPSPGAVAPDFRLADAEGRRIELSSLRGQVVILHFWASWCHHCTVEMPLIQKLGSDTTHRGVKVLAINLGESPRRVTRYLRLHQLDLEVLLDSRGKVAEKYGIVGLPTTIVIDREGRILREIPMGSLSREKIDALLP